MIAIASEKPVCRRGWQRRCAKLLPKVRSLAKRAFRRLRFQEREEAVADVLAKVCTAYRRLVELDKESIAYPTPLARFAIAQYRSGRRAGTSTNSRDVFNPMLWSRRGINLVHFGAIAEDELLAATLADRRRTPVPDQVAMRIDFSEWLRGLPQRDRRVAKFLALGHTTSETAAQFGLSLARISQIRGELHANWLAFHGESIALVKN